MLTQGELAVKAGVDASTIVRLEKGISPTELSSARQPAEARGVESWLLTEPPPA